MEILGASRQKTGRALRCILSIFLQKIDKDAAAITCATRGTEVST